MFLLLLLFSQMSSPPYEPPGCQEGSPASPPSEPEGQGGRGRGRQGSQGGRKAETSLQEAGVSKTSRWGDTSPVAAVVMSCRQVTDRAERLRVGVSPRKLRQSVVVGKGRSHTMLTRSSKALAQRSPPRPRQSSCGKFGRGLSPRDPRNRFLGTIQENTAETKVGETSPSLATRFATASPSSH